MLAIYTRLSKEDESSTSIENQLREGKAFAKKQNEQFTIYNEGEGVSGTAKIELRPALSNLIDDIKKGVISIVWMRNQNRLDRNTATFYLFVSAVKDANVDVYFGDAAVMDFNDPNTLLTATIVSSLNQYQADLQGLQTRKVLRDNVIEGKAWGVIPYGFKSDENKKLVINEDEAEIVKKIYAMSLEGIGTRSIANEFNLLGIPTRYNKYGKGTLTTTDKYDKRKRTVKKSEIKWSGNTVRHILNNTIYKGQRKWNDEFFEITPIVTPEYWQEVNDNFKNNSNNAGKKQEHEYLLKGIVRCGRCGRNYYGRTRVNKKDNFYTCSSKRLKHSCGNRSINITMLDSLISMMIWSDSGFISHLENHFNSADIESKLKELETKNTNATKQLAKVNTRIQRLIDMRLDGLVSDSDLKAKNDKLVAERSELNRAITEISKEIHSASMNRRGTDSIKQRLHELKPQFEEIGKQVEKRVKESNIDLKDYLKVNVSKEEFQSNYEYYESTSKDFAIFPIELYDSVISYEDRKEIVHDFIKSITIYFDDEDTFYLDVAFYDYEAPNFTMSILKNFIKPKGSVIIDENITFVEFFKKSNRTYGIYFKSCFQDDFTALKRQIDIT